MAKDNGSGELVIVEPLSMQITFEHWTVDDLSLWFEANGNARKILANIKRLSPVKKWNREGDPNDPEALERLDLDEWADYYTGIDRFLTRLYKDGCRTNITARLDIKKWSPSDLGEWQDAGEKPEDKIRIISVLRPFVSWNRDGDPNDAEALRALPMREYIDLIKIVREDVNRRFQRT